jgi:hypothetical protein
MYDMMFKKQQNQGKEIGKSGVAPSTGMCVRLKGSHNRGKISEVSSESITVVWDAGETVRYPADGDSGLLLVDEDAKNK